MSASMNWLKLIVCFCFHRSTPTRLQHEVFFKICYHFGFRGREWIRDLKRADILFEMDSSNCEYVSLSRQRISKNVKASLRRKENGDKKSITMYSVPEEPELCPVAAVRMYLSKMHPNCEELFHKAVKNWSSDSEIWYCPKGVLGKNTLNEMMKKISSAATLSRSYTNHCIRATVVTELKEANIPVEDIQVVTGHKNRTSVDRYIKNVSHCKKQKLSAALSASLKGNSQKGKVNC